MIGKIEQLTIGLSDLRRMIESLDKKFGDNEPFKWDLYINKVDNGYILTPSDKDQSLEVIECTGDEKEAITELLFAVYEYFCSMEAQHNKWGNKNLRITWDEEGSGYEPPESYPSRDSHG